MSVDRNLCILCTSNSNRDGYQVTAFIESPSGIHPGSHLIKKDHWYDHVSDSWEGILRGLESRLSIPVVVGNYGDFGVIRVHDGELKLWKDSQLLLSAKAGHYEKANGEKGPLIGLTEIRKKRTWPFTKVLGVSGSGTICFYARVELLWESQYDSLDPIGWTLADHLGIPYRSE